MSGWIHALWQKKLCLLCLEQVQGRQAICAACQHDLPWLLHACCDCALPLPAGDIRCRQCQQQPFVFSTVAAPWRYAFPVDALIGRFKYSAGWSYGFLLSQGLAEHLQYLYREQYLSRPDYLLAVPLARNRQRQRGYNQAQMIAQWLAVSLQIEYLGAVLRRIRQTQTQQGLSARQRRHNLSGAFAVEQVQLLRGKHVALVDDVVTTGATCATIASELLAAGVRRVDVYCLARTGQGRSQSEVI